MRPDLAALVGSRICHDLISPLGAIGNGVELLSLTNAGDTSAEMGLISESVDNANARIRFFRIAYGAAKADQMIARSEAISVLAAATNGGRFNYFWQVAGDSPRRDVRLAFLMLQCCETALPLGGDITVTCTDDQWHISATGRRIAIDDDLWAALQSPRKSYDFSAAQVQFALFPSVLSDTKRSLKIDHSADGIDVQF